jgi:ABC-2 type transport system ATP-binding protein
MSIVEVLASDTQAAQIELGKQPEVASVTQLGTRLRVLIPESISDPLERVHRVFSSKNLEASSELVSASLEDVFVAATLNEGDVEEAA